MHIWVRGNSASISLPIWREFGVGGGRCCAQSRSGRRLLQPRLETTPMLCFSIAPIPSPPAPNSLCLSQCLSVLSLFSWGGKGAVWCSRGRPARVTWLRHREREAEKVWIWMRVRVGERRKSRGRGSAPLQHLGQRSLTANTKQTSSPPGRHETGEPGKIRKMSTDLICPTLPFVRSAVIRDFQTKCDLKRVNPNRDCNNIWLNKTEEKNENLQQNKTPD